MKTLRLILNDQLSHSIAALSNCNKHSDIVLMIETLDELKRVKHHKKKIILLLSAMRHFSEELKANGYKIEYIQLEDARNTQSLKKELKKAIEKHQPSQVVVTHPSEYGLLHAIKQWGKKSKIPFKILEDNRFMCSKKEFKTWSTGRKQLRMEYFYRHMRKKHAILMDESKPVGGKWNFDSENRNPFKKKTHIPKTHQSKPDAITKNVIALIPKFFSDHFGDSTHFHFAVTRRQALIALKKFIHERLSQFGDHQDIMQQDEPWMYHAHISFYLNCGLLLPHECIRAAEKAYHAKKVPLNAAEGFIRQILGWREYIRGIYWLKMPQYAKENYLDAKNPLPNFYWTGHTKMNCMKQCILQTKQLAYAHHIQRLMVLGNFALLSAVNPKAVNEWYLIVYADAYEWVELPNVSGMVLFADGGTLGSKPYAASGAYINKMSNYCQQCPYRVNKKNGPDACPFNYLFWHFLARNRKKLINNPRIRMMYNTYDKMHPERKNAIKKDSMRFLQKLINQE
jgi:deoxyribodipyrimidine photolyase-related protein